MKKSAPNSESATPALPIRILKIGTCPSLSGKSSLTYRICSNAESELLCQVTENSSSGYFSRELVAMKAIQQLFADVPAEKGITSFLLHTLFEGKSQNNAGFLLAVLVAEKLVEPVPETRYYRCTDGQQFAAVISQLLASGTNIQVDEPPTKLASKVKGKTANVEPETPATTPAPSVAGKKAKGTIKKA